MKFRLGLVIVLALIAAVATIEIKRQRGRFFINPESAGLFLLNDGNFRSWRIEYSYGQTIEDGKWKTLWHWPQFLHHDMNRDWATLTNFERIVITPIGWTK